MGRGRCLRADLQPAPGRSGHHACRHYDRHARCVAGCGQAVGGVTPAPWTVFPTKPGPDRTKGPHTPWEEPWWNAGRRARPTAEGAAQAALSVARRRARWHGVLHSCVCRRSASLLYILTSSLRGAAATKQSRTDPLHWIASLSLAMTLRSSLFDIVGLQARASPRRENGPVRACRVGAALVAAHWRACRHTTGAHEGRPYGARQRFRFHLSSIWRKNLGGVLAEPRRGAGGGQPRMPDRHMIRVLWMPRRNGGHAENPDMGYRCRFRWRLQSAESP